MAEESIRVLAETDSFSMWESDDPDGEVTYHVELGNVTVHLFREELEELIELVKLAEVDVGRR